MAGRGEELLELPLSAQSIVDLKPLIEVLVEEVGLASATFWEGMTEAVRATMEEAVMEDLVDIAHWYSKLRFWSDTLFDLVYLRASQQSACHVLEPHALTRLLEAYSRAAASSTRLQRKGRELVSEASQRLLDAAEEFQ